MSRPAPVRIDDLSSPRFPAEMQPIIDSLNAMASQIRIEPAWLMRTAREQTGLDDFGDDAFVERLDAFAHALNAEAGLAPIGVVTQGGLLMQLLKNRLLIEDLIKRHPEIEKVEVAAPIIICGLPRTGTTHLHNLMSADPELRYLPYWEALEPVLAEHERPAPGEPDPRLARCELALGFTNGCMPYFERMHEMTLEHAHEEIQLLAIDMSSVLFETTAPMPSWRAYYTSHDQTPAYAYLKRVLRVLTWLRGGDRWVLKSPQHMEQFGPLLATFPDATFVVTHRDPVSVTASAATMLSYTARMAMAAPDPRAVGAYWSDRLEEMLRATVRDRDLLPADRTIDVHFDEFMADDVAMVERIYDVAGQPLPDTSRKAMSEFMAAHPRGRHGGVIYDLDELGIDAAERRDALMFYVDRFGVRLES
jgi:sulfotransferase family protein